MCFSYVCHHLAAKKQTKRSNIGGVKERRASFLDINLPPLSFLMIIDKGTNHQIYKIFGQIEFRELNSFSNIL